MSSGTSRGIVLPEPADLTKSAEVSCGSLVAVCSSKYPVEPVAQAIVQAGQQVPVAVEGEANGRMAEPLGDLLGVGALGDEQRDAGVAQIMETQARLDAGPLHSRVEVTAQEMAAQRQPGCSSGGTDISAVCCGELHAAHVAIRRGICAR